MTRDVNGLVAVIRQPTRRLAGLVARSFVDAGIDLIEITMTTPGALELIEECSTTGARVGAGTVLDASQAASALDAGATFLVSPVTDADVLAVAREAGLDYVGGATTPGEVHAALRIGVRVVKIFPINVMGGADYIRTLRGPFPQLRSVVSGGVHIADFADYLDAGAEGICVGSELLDQDALADGDLARQTQHAAAVRQRYEEIVAAHAAPPEGQP